LILKTLGFFILLFTLNFSLFSQSSNEFVIDHLYFSKNQIRQITFYYLVDKKWINNHPAFSHEMNLKRMTLKYNTNGNCEEVSWSLCHWDSTKNDIDTSVSSLENYLYLKYDGNKLVRIDAISFSEINFVDFKYADNKVFRHISYIENSILKTKDDTISNLKTFQELPSPYDWTLFPQYMQAEIDETLSVHFYINNIPLNYFDENLANKNLKIELFPGFLLRII